jgi:hypothetical protein
MSNLKSGLSGCKLELLDNSSLRKYSSSMEYNSRLSSQIKKQKLFSNFILKNIDTPKIYNSNFEFLYYFDMEYISGLSFEEYFSTSCINNIDFVVHTLFEYFDFLISNIRIFNIKNKLISKIESLEKKTEYGSYLSFIKNDILNKETVSVPKTFCHGDLTFSNILFHKNRLFFIDFLDSYIDSFLCDMVKLKQDLYYFWNLKLNRIGDIRIKQSYRYIWKNLYFRYQNYIESDEFKILDSLNLLRIEPYLTNSKQKSILNSSILKSDLYEKFNCTNGREII